ncbi:phage/conjugal plasmid C-4 type zinc finger protein, TraR family [Catenovulum agarivorans DS-2]|uniref:Phage/conjugal plasmid C-4 type zinc finger protein, TraR family n=1 Tax=Catenovulum agarivorans DS-2 TaxID=1328313 RepID=W7QAK9_9ALTE|nr:TraR/DksA C4-type zinc finger protein [Catenovulum agarivorans]EWH09849.1 phage/conjugal plasmid C-4 type zinc finger protein, TraR family [Catenovulum agarivorans DS-2]
MDNADRAQDLIEMRTNHALQANKAKFKGADIDEPYCLACGIEIPQARRKAVHNCEYCIDCQQEQELRRRQQLGG